MTTALLRRPSGGFGGPPTGGAGGDLGGSYPSPTVLGLTHVTSASLSAGVFVTAPGSWQRASRATDTAGVVSSTTVVTAGLGWTIGANATWTASYSFAVTCSSVGGVRINVSLPAGASGTIRVSTVDHNGGTAVSIYAINQAIGADIVPITATTTDHLIAVSITVTSAATPGTVDLTYAQQNSDGTATKIMAGAVVSAERIL